MDVQMPHMDDLEATAAIRETEKESREHVPIIAMTGHAMKGDMERCLNAGNGRLPHQTRGPGASPQSCAALGVAQVS
jgi:CheY-like chemotaxis protein